MKVLFYSPLAALSYHFETDLELIKRHQDEGDEVYVIGCEGDLKKVGYFGCKGLLRCSMCVSKWNQGVSLLDVPGENRNIIKIFESRHVWNYSSIAELRSVNYRDVDIGAATASTIISNVRETNFSLERYRSNVNDVLDSMASLTDQVYRFLDEISPDLVYLFNGRFSLYRPMMRACQNRNIPFYIHERSGSVGKFSLTSNTYPHDLAFKKNEINSLWESSADSVDVKTQRAVKWFEERRRGAAHSWYSFTDKQISGLLPPGFSHSKRNIAIYVSSEDEFSAIEGWGNPYFESQADGIEFIIQSFRNDSRFHFYVRVHPNLKGLRNSQVRFLENLVAPNVTVIEAANPISSYYLMDACEKVVSFGSTIGAEAVYAKKPSILLGRTFYEDMEGLSRPHDKNHVISLIEEQLPSPDPRGIYPYAYWIVAHGVKFKYFSPTNLTTGRFMGIKIVGSKFFLFFSFLSSFFINLFAVLRGQMSWGFLWNRLKNKIDGVFIR